MTVHERLSIITSLEEIIKEYDKDKHHDLLVELHDTLLDKEVDELRRQRIEIPLLEDNLELIKLD